MSNTLTITLLISIIGLVAGIGFYLDYLDKHDLRDLERFQRITRALKGGKPD